MIESYGVRLRVALSSQQGNARASIWGKSNRYRLSRFSFKPISPIRRAYRTWLKIMRQTNLIETVRRGVFSRLAHFAGIIAVVLTAFMATSCGEDDEPSTSGSLVGTWVLEESLSDYDSSAKLKMTLKFNSDNTGSVVEEWTSESRATEHNIYSMNFSWSTTTDSDGDDILRVSYVSGDKNTELFSGNSSTVLWSRQYVITGKILNVYVNNGVWVFNKK